MSKNLNYNTSNLADVFSSEVIDNCPNADNGKDSTSRKYNTDILSLSRRTGQNVCLTFIEGNYILLRINHRAPSVSCTLLWSQLLAIQMELMQQPTLCDTQNWPVASTANGSGIRGAETMNLMFVISSDDPEPGVPKSDPCER